MKSSSPLTVHLRRQVLFSVSGGQARRGAEGSRERSHSRLGENGNSEMKHVVRISGPCRNYCRPGASRVRATCLEGAMVPNDLLAIFQILNLARPAANRDGIRYVAMISFAWRVRNTFPLTLLIQVDPPMMRTPMEPFRSSSSS